MSFAGKTVFITGTNRGLGRAFVEAFASRGANIIAHARKESSEFFRFISETSRKNGVEIRDVYFDMTDSIAMKSVVRDLVKARIPVNVLVNNAGIAHGGLFQMTSMDKIREVFEVNLFSHMVLTQQLMRYMTCFSGGSIVNIASISGQDLKRGNCAYGVSKAALIAFTRVLAAEVAKSGLRVNAVCPGLTATDMANLMESNAEAEMIARSAMNRLGEPQEIAKVVTFLASEEASFVNGQIVAIDGGRA